MDVATTRTEELLVGVGGDAEEGSLAPAMAVETSKARGDVRVGAVALECRGHDRMQRGATPAPLAFVPWADPVDDDMRRARGLASYRDVHGVDSAPPRTAFRGTAYLDFLYGEVWTRDEYLTRRDRRVISICSAAALSVASETREQVHAALATGDLTCDELQELVVHFGVYCGWLLGRQLDDALVEVADELGVAT